MKFDVILQPIVENLQQIAAELLASWAAKPFSPPNSANGMLAPIALLHNDAQHAAKGLGFAQGLFHADGFRFTQPIIKIGVEQFAIDAGHASRSGSDGRFTIAIVENGDTSFNHKP